MSVWSDKKREERNSESKQQHTHIHSLTHSLQCPKCGSALHYRDGLRYLRTGKTVQRWLCRKCGFRFSESGVKVKVTQKVGEAFNSKKNNHEVRVASGDSSVNVASDGLSFLFGEDVASHNLSIVEKGLNNFPVYKENSQVCAQKDAKNLDTTNIKNCCGRYKEKFRRSSNSKLSNTAKERRETRDNT